MPGLLDAAKAGDQTIVQRLLASGADPDAPVEIVYRPRNAGASTTACRWSPMHFACAGGHEAVVAALLVAGAQNGQSTGDTPALAVAEGHGHLRCALLLQLSQRTEHWVGNTTAADNPSVTQAVSVLESRWASRLREMNARNADLRKRAEWAEGMLQRQVQAVAREPPPPPIEEGEAPAHRVGGAPHAQPEREQRCNDSDPKTMTGEPCIAAVGTDGVLETVLGRRRVCPVCMDKPRQAAMVPCGHTACLTCASQLDVHRGACAECNANIEMVLPLFGV